MPKDKMAICWSCGGSGEVEEQEYCGLVKMQCHICKGTGFAKKSKNKRPATHPIMKDEFTLRDRFAIEALNGFIAAGEVFLRGAKPKQTVSDHLATIAYFQADAMLKARKK